MNRIIFIATTSSLGEPLPHSDSFLAQTRISSQDTYKPLPAILRPSLGHRVQHFDSSILFIDFSIFRSSCLFFTSCFHCWIAVSAFFTATLVQPLKTFFAIVILSIVNCYVKCIIKCFPRLKCLVRS